MVKEWISIPSHVTYHILCAFHWSLFTSDVMYQFKHPGHFFVMVINVLVCCANMAPRACEEKGGPYL